MTTKYSTIRFLELGRCLGWRARDGGFEVRKTLSTPDDPSRAVLEGVEQHRAHREAASIDTIFPHSELEAWGPSQAFRD